MAAAGGASDVVEWLLANGADATIVAEDGRSALHAAAAEGHAGCCQLLVNVVPASLCNKKDLTNCTAPQLAHTAQHLSCVRVMLMAMGRGSR